MKSAVTIPGRTAILSITIVEDPGGPKQKTLLVYKFHNPLGVAIAAVLTVELADLA